MRDPARFDAFVPDDAGRAADGNGVGAQVVGARQDIGLGQVDRILHEQRKREHVSVTPEVGRDGGLIAAGRAVAADVPGLQVRRGGDELVAVPHPRGESCLIVRRVLRRTGPAVHPDRHRRARLPGGNDPRLHLAGDRIGNGPHPEAEGPGRDMPLRLEPAGALRHRDDGLGKAERLGPSRFVERQPGPVVGVRARAPLERVFMVDRRPGP